MSEKGSEKLSINDMPEGQKRILDLCGNINLWYLGLRENNVQNASSQKIMDLLDKTQSLYESTESLTNFDTNDPANVKLGVERARLQREFQTTQEWLLEIEEWHSIEVPFDQESLNPDKMAKMTLEQTSKGGREKITFIGIWEEPGGKGGTYGDFVRVDAKKDLKGEMMVEYYEVFDFTTFKNSHLFPIETKDGVDLSRIRQLFTGSVRNFTKPVSKSSYYAQEMVLDNIRYTARGHDNGGTELAISIKCNKNEEMADTVRYLLGLVKDNPKVEETSKL